MLGGACRVRSKALWKRYKPDDAYKRHERGQIDDAEYFAVLRTMLEIDISDAQFLDGWNATFSGPIAGVEAGSGRPARLPSYVFSNTNPAHELYFRAHYGDLLKPFRTVFHASPDDRALRKPDLEAFEFVAREMGVAPGRILFFDDVLAEPRRGAARRRGCRRCMCAAIWMSLDSADGPIITALMPQKV